MAAQANPTSSKHLEDQAAAAALYVTDPAKQTRDYRKEASFPLDANGKLTSAGAAASLKRAEAKDLPSFPSVGLAQSAAGGAAGLAVQNTKSPEWWKPEASAGASKAALLAKDYKMKPLWQPESSAAGSKAAILAHQKGHGLNLWEPTASEKALIAATGAAAGQKGIQHGKSQTSAETGLVDRYPDEKNAAKNALRAATSVHTVRNRYQDLGGLTEEEAEKVKRQAMVKGMVGDMFGSNPLIGPELQERQHQESLHAAAVTMAQGMYGKRDQAYRDKMAARAGSRAAAARGLDDDSDEEDSPMSFMGLQEAAQKLANERLAKLNDPDAAYREHYGTNSPPPKNRMSVFSAGSLRRKDSDDDLADEKRSRKIRGEMNLFQDKLKEIDARKRKDDRAALLAAAQRNVKALSATMDEDVFQRTGKMSPAMKADWETQARARAQAASEERNANFGKVGIGGGKYLDQTEIDAIARGRLQPTLDAISAKAQHDREVDEQNRLIEEERRRIAQEQKEQEAYQNMKVKEEWKKFKAEEKAEERAHKQEEKIHRDEDKQAEQDAKMQEKFEHDKQKEHENEIKTFEKEKEKQQKEEWKAFKEQEKEAEKARKDEKRGSRFGSIFRRKSKKEKEPTTKEDKPVASEIPAGTAAMTTTITAGGLPVSTEPREAVEHEEHHNPLAALEQTPEAKAANQQKPGGSLFSLLKTKKAEHDEKKTHSTAEAATAGVATGALAGAVATETSTHAGKDEPAKAQAHTGTPAPEALAPEHSTTEKAVEPVTEPATIATATPIAAAPVQSETSPSSQPLTTATVSEPSGLMYDPQIAASRITADEGENIVAATTTGATISDSAVDRAEKPAVHDAGHESVPAPRIAPVEEAETVPEPVTAPTSPVQDSTTRSEAPPASVTGASKQLEQVQQPAPVAEKSAIQPAHAPAQTDRGETVPETMSESASAAAIGPQSAGPVALGSDKPVTSEINHSEIIDILDPRANVGKPGFTGSEKRAAATADMRGTDHAGAATSTDGAADNESAELAGTDVFTSPAAHSSHAKSAEATHEGEKVTAPVTERIAVPAEAAAASEGSGGKVGQHGTPRQAENKKQNRLSGFFKNKLGMKIKEHKGSDGVTVTPTTQYTTMGKYVDPNDRHSLNKDAAIPANAATLESSEASSSAGQKTADKATTESTDASAIAVDPAFQEDGQARGRVPSGKVHSEESDEARDTVAEQLSPPKIPGPLRASESPARETRFKEELFN